MVRMRNELLSRSIPLVCNADPRVEQLKGYLRDW